MDEKMLKAYDLYVESKAKMPSSSSMKEFYRTEDCDHVLDYLNILELMAVGIHHNTFDQRICFVYWCDFIKESVADCRAHSYEDLVRLEKRWTSAKRLWQLWRNRPRV